MLTDSSSLEHDTKTSKAIVKFSKNLNVESAFTRMTSEIESILELQKFPNLRRACVQRINSLGSNLPHSLVAKIRHTATLDDMLDVFSESPYWNWFDTRLLQALVSASGSPEAEQWLESFKATFYTKKVTEVIPYISIKPLKESIDIIEKFDKNPKDLTISELLEHKYKLEYEVLDIDEGELVLSCIKTGCVELTWQIPPELVYQAYTSMKRKHDELSSLAVKSLICKEADEFAGLPILWRGQEVGDVGPIEPLPEHVRQEPYSLPQGFHWVTLSSNNIDKVATFSSRFRTDVTGLTFEQNLHIINHYLTYPNAKGEWQFGIQTTGGKLVGMVLARPNHICIGKERITFISAAIRFHSKYHNKRLPYMLTRKLQRRANLSKINHLILPYNRLFQPICTVVQWIYYFNQLTSSQLPSSPRTPGWRRMISEDVPSALALINKWSSQFEIRQVFNSEEEISHNLLLPKGVFTYVIEDKTKNITDLVSYSLPSSMPNAHIFVVISTQTQVKQLITDALVCVSENDVRTASICQHNIENDVLFSLSFLPSGSNMDHFYNLKYHEVSENNFWIMVF